MRSRHDIGFQEALSFALELTHTLPPNSLPVDRASGLVAAEECTAVVNCPSVTSSLKDGYAVHSRDIAGASPGNPVRLRLAGKVFAGGVPGAAVDEGTAVGITTGAALPPGADAVLASEFSREEDGQVVCLRDAGPGRNIMAKGADVGAGQAVVRSGQLLTPALTGLLAAGGVSRVKVRPRPRVGILAIGDEIALPGRPLGPGQLYASNMVTLRGWLERFRMEAETFVVPDDRDDVRRKLTEMLDRSDVILTSGGVWKSERDFTAEVLAKTGKIVFHRVRIGPGKAVALSMVAGKPVFSLPGGPASNEMAFLQLTLPALLKMSGREPAPFALRRARLTSGVEGIEGWTQFYQAWAEERRGGWTVAPLRQKSRLRSQAEANALFMIPEGTARIGAGETIPVQILFGPEERGRTA